VKKKAVVLLSGGVDSSTTLAIAKDLGFEVYALSFDYGQRNNVELKSAGEMAKAIGVKEHRIFDIDLRTIGASALTGDLSVYDKKKRDGNVPATYVPARNTIFLSIALAWIETLGGKDIFIGVNVVDYSGYPDCRPEYITAFENLSKLATASGAVRIHAPLLHMSKAEIIKKGMSLGVDYSKTWSCYAPDTEVFACGRCESCRIRMEAFGKAGLSDPASYKAVFRESCLVKKQKL